MTEPVIAADGYTYERKAIEQWLLQHTTSYVTTEVLASTHTVPNHSLRSIKARYEAEMQRQG